MNTDEILKKFNEIALKSARVRVSEQTGFLHHHYHADGIPQTIPVLENVIFAYALLRNKSAETIQEAKDLLQKILPFQCEDGSLSQGNFPIYLHDYPLCRDRLLSINLLPILYWIIQQFNTVLGSDLNDRIRLAVENLIQHSLQSSSEKPLPYTNQIKLSSALKAFGNLFGNKTLSDLGQTVMNDKENDRPRPEWFSPVDLSDILLSLQLTGMSLKDSGWGRLWEHLCVTYSQAAGTYVGPSLQNYYWKNQSQLTLYDFFMSCYSQTITERLKEDSIHQLQASLIQPHSNNLLKTPMPFSLDGEIEGHHWSMMCNESLCASTLDHEGNKLENLWKGVFPMHLYILDAAGPISMVAQGGNYRTIKGTMDDFKIALEYVLPLEIDVEDKEEKKEVILSISRGEELSILVNGGKSNTFKLDDEVAIHLKNHCVKLTFSLLEGEGRFMGHIMPGNRASQLALKNGNRFNAYDWQFFLRTLSRSGQCRIEVDITVQRSL